MNCVFESAENPGIVRTRIHAQLDLILDSKRRVLEGKRRRRCAGLRLRDRSSTPPIVQALWARGHEHASPGNLQSHLSQEVRPLTHVVSELESRFEAVGRIEPMLGIVE